MSKLYRESSIDASYQVSVHLAKWFQRRRFFRNQPIRNKNCLWWPCLLTERDEMRHHNRRPFHRCFLPSFGSFGQTVSEEKNLKNQPIKYKNRLWWPCLLTDRDGMSNLYRRPSIDVCRGPSNEHSCSLALIIFVVSEKKAFEYFPIGSNVNLCPAVAAILDFRSA
jgi:hypothetical protein